MRFVDSPSEATWRAEVRNFLNEALPPEHRRGARGQQRDGEVVTERPETLKGGEGYREATGAMADFRTALVNRGWIAPAWPKEYGGAGLSVMDQFILNEELAEAGAPQVGGTGVSQVGPTLIV